MPISTPIHKIAKDIGIDTKRVLLACKKLGIYAKGSSKRMNEEESNKIRNYFETGKNVSEEVINIDNNTKEIDKGSKENQPKVLKNKTSKINYFSNRLIG
tara:strand:+ start:3318 stop:3617 length:300 start_codon:yes stop_codon:yes gene_type:complete